MIPAPSAARALCALPIALLVACGTVPVRVPVVRPRMLETTALDAAYLAGLAVNVWRGLEDIPRSGRSTAASNR